MFENHLVLLFSCRYSAICPRTAGTYEHVEPERAEESAVPDEVHGDEHEEQDAEHLMHRPRYEKIRKPDQQQHDERGIEQRTFLHRAPSF